MFIKIRDAISMKYTAKCTFLPITAVLNHAYSFKMNQTNFLILIILTKKIIPNLFLKEKSYVIKLIFMQKNF